MRARIDHLLECFSTTNSRPPVGVFFPILFPIIPPIFFLPKYEIFHWLWKGTKFWTLLNISFINKNFVYCSEKKKIISWMRWNYEKWEESILNRRRSFLFPWIHVEQEKKSLHKSDPQNFILSLYPLEEIQTNEKKIDIKSINFTQMNRVINRSVANALSWNQLSYHIHALIILPALQQQFWPSSQQILFFQPHLSSTITKKNISRKFARK